MKLKKESKHPLLKFFTLATIAGLVLILLIHFANAVSIDWSNTKTVSTSNFEITAPKDYTTCIIYPDDSGKLDSCEAVFLIKNKWKDIFLQDKNLTFTWDKTVSSQQIFYYSSFSWKNTTTCDADNVCSTVSEKEFTNGQPLASAYVPLGAEVYVSVKFQKPRWSKRSFNVSIGATKLDPDVGECGTLASANSIYTMNTSLNATNTCFTITAENITLDCNHYAINYTYSTLGYGVNVQANGSVIENCDIETTNTSVSNAHGIYLKNVYHTRIIGNSIRTLAAGGSGAASIYLDTGCQNNSIINNSITSGAGSGVMISTSSPNQTVYNNTISASGANVYSLRLRSSSVNASDNSIYGNGNAVSAEANNYVISDNNITATAANNIAYAALRIIASNGSLISGNNITCTGNQRNAILMNLSSNNTFINNVITEQSSTTGASAIFLSNYNQHNAFNSNVFSGKSIVVRVGNETGYHGNNLNNSFTNDSILACTISCITHAALTVNGSSSVIFTNVTFNRTNVTIGGYNLTVRWYARVNVSSASGQVQSATANLTDNATVNTMLEDTDASGLTSWRVFTEFVANDTYSDEFGESSACANSANVSCYTPLLATVNKSGYSTNQTYFGAVSSQTFLIILTATGGPTTDAVKVTLWIDGVEANKSTVYAASNFNVSAAVNVTYPFTVEIFQNDSFVATGTTVAEYIANLKAGTYYFQGRFNGSTGNVSTANSSVLWLVVAKAPCETSLELNSDPLNFTGTYPDNSVSAVGRVNCSETIPYIYLNGSEVADGNNEFFVAQYLRNYSAGLWFMSTNYSGDENHSSVSNGSLRWIQVFKGNCQAKLALNGSEADSTYILNATVNATGFKQCSNGMLYLILNDSVVHATSTLVVNISYYTTASYWNYTLNYSGDENYSSQVITYFVIVTTLPPEAISFISINVYPNALQAIFVTVTNASANVTIELSPYSSINESQNYSSNLFLLTTNLTINSLNVSQVYYFRAYAYTASGIAIRSITYAFKSLLIQSVAAPEKGMEFYLLLVILVFIVGLSIYAVNSKDLFLLILAPFLNLIAGNYLFQGTYLILNSSTLIYITYSNYFIQSVGVAFVFFSLYLFIELFIRLQAVFTARREK